MKIKEARKSRGMSQKELADALGLTRSTVSMWEIGASYPSAPQIIAVCRLLGVSSDYLLSLDEDETKPQEQLELEGAVGREIYEKLTSDPRKLDLARWIAERDDKTLEQLERLLDALQL